MLDEKLKQATIILGSYLLDEVELTGRKKNLESNPLYISTKKDLSAVRKKIKEIREGIGDLALQIFERDGSKTITDSIKIQERETVTLIEDEETLIEWCVKKELLGFLQLKVNEFKEAAPHIKPDAIEIHKEATCAISNPKILEEARNNDYDLEEEPTEIDDNFGF